MTAIPLIENPLTFTKLFCERRGTTFANVLYQCLTTPELLGTFNRVNAARIVFEQPQGEARAGRVVCLEAGVPRERQIDRIAGFAWREVFLKL